MTANQLTAELLIEIPKRFPHVRVWRQNTGGGIGMSTVKQAVALIQQGRTGEAVKLLLSRPIKFGLSGTADIIGIIGPYGRMLQVEVKVAKDKMSEDQESVQSMVVKRGGVYIEVRTPEDAYLALEREVESMT